MRTDQAIKCLVVSYHSFSKAREAIFEDKTLNGTNVDNLWVWGETLKHWQAETGVEMHGAENIDMLISYAKRQLAEQSAPSIVEVA